MGVNPEKLKELKRTIPYMWRVQQQAEYGATCVAYIDARDVQDILDEVVGAENWQNDYRIIDNTMFGGIAINIEGTGWVWKWDCGTESMTEKEKGQASDSIKRAAVNWGVGRFLYNLGLQKTKVAKHTNGKLYPADDNGKIIWDGAALTAFINTKIKPDKNPQTTISSDKPKYSDKKETTTPAYSKGSWSDEIIGKIKKAKRGELSGKELLKSLIPDFNTRNNTTYENVSDFNNDTLMNQLLDYYESLPPAGI